MVHLLTYVCPRGHLPNIALDYQHRHVERLGIFVNEFKAADALLLRSIIFGLRRPLRCTRSWTCQPDGFIRVVKSDASLIATKLPTERVHYIFSGEEFRARVDSHARVVVGYCWVAPVPYQCAKLAANDDTLNNLCAIPALQPGRTYSDKHQFRADGCCASTIDTCDIFEWTWASYFLCPAAVMNFSDNRDPPPTCNFLYSLGPFLQRHTVNWMRTALDFSAPEVQYRSAGGHFWAIELAF